MQNMFELSYFTDNGESVVPTGWNAIDDTKNYPLLASRAPPEDISPIDSDASKTWQNGASDEDSPGDDTAQGSTVTRMADESSEEDGDPIQPARVRTLCAVNGCSWYTLSFIRRRLTSSRLYLAVAVAGPRVERATERSSSLAKPTPRRENVEKSRCGINNSNSRSR
jgi:hypothetical protein